MSDPRGNHVVDPIRFSGKKFTRRQAFPATADDFVVRIDGLTAGRIMRKTVTGQRVAWFWTLTAPYFPGTKSMDGKTDTFEAARDAFKKAFWEWHAWAVKQPGKATWYGADE